jgi:hypothetical protein
MKIEAFFSQSKCVHGLFSGRIQRIQNTPVLAQYIVNPTHIIIRVFIQPIVVGVATIISAEFLVLSSVELCAAF